MSFYQKIAEYGVKVMSKKTLFKYGFNFSPMYRRSTARIIYVSDDLLQVSIKLKISYKNRGFFGTIFGGSMFSAVDPIPLTQLANLLGDDYVVWDKSAEILFKIPAKENLYADFHFSQNELENIKQQLLQENEIEILKTTKLVNKDKTKTYCEVRKKIYIADKEFYKNKPERHK